MKIKIIVLAISLISCFCTRAQNYSPTYFSKADFTEDLEFLNQKVADMHPKLIDRAALKQWQNLFSTIEKNLPDSISYNDAYITASKALAQLHDAHSCLLFSYSERAKYMKTGVTMPFTVKLINSKLCMDQYFGDNRSANFSGAEIRSINSIPATEILTKMRSLSASVSSYDVEHYFGPYFWMFWGAQSAYKVSMAKGDSLFSVTTKGVSNDDYFKLKHNYYPKEQTKMYELSFLDSSSTAIIKIDQFVPQLAPFFRQAFDQINQHKSQNLIVDVRNNPGGMGVYIDSLLNYLTKDTLTQYPYTALRVSKEVKERYQKKKPDLYKLIANLPDGSLYEYSKDMLTSTFETKRVFFKGNIYVLINQNTSSAAATFAGLIKDYKMGKLIGQPTGGTIRFYANALRFKLPHLGEEFTVSPVKFVQHGGSDPDQGVIPDVLLKDDNLSVSQIVKRYCYL